MHRRSMRFGGIAVFILLASALWATAAALAGPRHRACSLSAGPLYPQLTSPCNGTSIAKGKRFTFTALDLNPNARSFPPYLYLTKTAPRRGKLSWTGTAFVLYESLHAVRGHRGLYEDRPPVLTYPGYPLGTSGKYYVQVKQIDASAHGGYRYSRVQTVFVR